MGIKSDHFTAIDTPDGGQTSGPGFAIAWQRGALVVDGERLEQNGAFVEDIIKAAVDRIEYYQATKFKSSYNEEALIHLAAALKALAERTNSRVERNVEGTHTV